MTGELHLDHVPLAEPNMDQPQQVQENQDPQNKTRIIAVCGGLNWDVISVTSRLPEATETFNSRSFEMMPGGKGADVAIALHRLSHLKPPEAEIFQFNSNMIEIADIEASMVEIPEGTSPPADAYDNIQVQVNMIGSIGSDIFGRQMKHSLSRHHVNVDMVGEVEGRSAIASIIVESETGQNRILVYPGANHFLKSKDFLQVSDFGPQRPDFVVSQLEFNRETVEQLLTTAKNAGIDTLLNPSPAHFLDDAIYNGLTHLIVNETEAALQTGRSIDEVKNGFDDWLSITDEFIELGVQHIVITLGAGGAYFSERKGEGELVPAVAVPPDRVIDTTGAGNPNYLPKQCLKQGIMADQRCSDVFVGAYAIQWLRQKEQNKWDMRATVEYANKASAQIIQCFGSQEAVPWADELIETIPPESTMKDPETVLQPLVDVNEAKALDVTAN